MGLLPPTRYGDLPHLVEIHDKGRSITWSCTCGESGRETIRKAFDRAYVHARARWHAELAKDKKR